jgi:hypothetical protein
MLHVPRSPRQITPETVGAALEDGHRHAEKH